MASKHPAGHIRVSFDESALYYHWHTDDFYDPDDPDSVKYTDEYEEEWKNVKTVLGEKHHWLLEGERTELENMLEEQLGELYIDNYIIRCINDNQAKYLLEKGLTSF